MAPLARHALVLESSLSTFSLSGTSKTDSVDFNSVPSRPDLRELTPSSATSTARHGITPTTQLNMATVLSDQ